MIQLGQESETGLARALQAITRKHDDLNAEQVLTKLLETQRKANSRDTGTRFGAARAAANLYRSLNPEGKERMRGLMRNIADEVPNLKAVVKRKESFRHEDDAEELALPEGIINPGLRLGHEKQRIGFSKEAWRVRKDALRAAKKKAKREGKVIRSSEVREALDHRKAAPRIKKKIAAPPRLPEHAKAYGVREGAALPGGVPKRERLELKVKDLKKERHMAFLSGEEDALLDQFGEAVEAAYRAADVPGKLQILDQVSDVRSSFDNVKAGTQTVETMKADIAVVGDEEEEKEFPWLWVGIGAAAVVAIVLVVVLTKD